MEDVKQGKERSTGYEGREGEKGKGERVARYVATNPTA